MDATTNLELLKIADRRASQDQSISDILTLAEALAVWVAERRFPEVAQTS